MKQEWFHPMIQFEINLEAGKLRANHNKNIPRTIVLSTLKEWLDIFEKEINDDKEKIKCKHFESCKNYLDKEYIETHGEVCPLCKSVIAEVMLESI